MSIVEVLLVVVIITVITSMSLPNMHQARIEANRIASLHTMAMLAEANGMYFHRHRIYAPGLSDLYAARLVEDARILAARSGSGQPMDGYFYYYNCRDPHTGFLLFATPAEHGKSGLMTYCVGELAQVFERDFGPTPHDKLTKEFEEVDYRIPPLQKLMDIFPNGRSMILKDRADDVWTQARVAFE